MADITYNGLQVGYKVEYETGEETEGGATHFIPGTVTKILSSTRLELTQRPGVSIEVDAEWCQRVYDCNNCNDTGEVIVSRAHQAYTPQKGTYIEDDVIEACNQCQL